MSSSTARPPRMQFTIGWSMGRIAVLAVLFLLLPYVATGNDWGAAVALLAAYAAIVVAIRPLPGAWNEVELD
jgi:hypothetical protein